MQAPSFRAFHALAVDDTGSRAGLSLGLLATFYVERVVNLLPRAGVAPQTEVVVHRAARWQVLWDVAPLPSGAQDVHHAVDHLAPAKRAACRHVWPGGISGLIFAHSASVRSLG